MPRKQFQSREQSPLFSQSPLFFAHLTVFIPSLLMTLSDMKLPTVHSWPHHALPLLAIYCIITCTTHLYWQLSKWSRLTVSDSPVLCWNASAPSKQQPLYFLSLLCSNDGILELLVALSKWYEKNSKSRVITVWSSHKLIPSLLARICYKYYHFVENNKSPNR